MFGFPLLFPFQLQSGFNEVILFSNSICKLYDYVFIDLNIDYLKTGDMQYVFKSNHSTVLCSAVYIETVNNYMNVGSEMFIAVLLTQAKLLTGCTGGNVFLH